MKETLIELWPGLRDFLAGLVPGALGATIAVTVQGAMTWTERLVQISVGIIVSYYANQAAVGFFELNAMLSNSVGFVAGLGAFECAKNLKTSLGDLARTAPREAWEKILGMFGRSK